MKIKLSQTGRRLSVLVGILTTMIASGCASQDTAQQGPHTKEVAFYEVTINFDSNGCPTGVTPPPSQKPLCDLHADGGVCAKRGDKIMWVSSPAGTQFEVYFDPFVGRPYKSLPPDHNKTSPVKIHKDSKKGKYEYSVFGKDCKSEDSVLDPPIRVEF